MPFLSHEQRLEATTNPLLKKLFGIMIQKKTNLCVAANFKTFDEIIDFLEVAGQHICILKTQALRYDGKITENLEKVYDLKKKFNFLIFEDNKLIDTPDTIDAYYRTHYVKYADFITVLPSAALFDAIESVAKEANLPDDEYRGCLAVCELSFNRAPPSDINKYLDVAKSSSDICVGIIAQTLKLNDPNMIKLSPGVHLELATDGRDQQWKPPSDVIERGADVVIVGRGITLAPKDQLEAITARYKEATYQAYLDHLR